MCKVNGIKYSKFAEREVVHQGHVQASKQTHISYHSEDAGMSAGTPRSMTQKYLHMLLGSTLFALLFLEGALHAYFRMQKGAWLWQNTAFRIGYTQPVADRRQYALRPNYTDPVNGITINAWGARGPLLSEEWPSLIVALGDSVPFGAGVRDDETYPAILDALVRPAFASMRVLNAGVASYNIRQSFDRLRYDVLKHYKKQVRVVTLQAANDVSLLTWYRQTWTPEVTWAGLWWGRSKTSAILHYILLAFGSTQPDKHRPYPGITMLTNLRQTLHEIAVFCASHNILVILLPIDPFYYQTHNRGKNETLENWPKYHEIFALWNPLINDFNNELLQASNNSKNVLFFDTRLIFDYTDRNRMYLDFIHYTQQGNRVIATALLDFLQARGIFATK